MDKQSLYIVFNDWLSEEGNCVYLHLVDKTDLLISKKPHFNNLTFSIELSHRFGEDVIHETHVIPYSSVVYITQTNIKDVNIVNDYYNKVLSKKEVEDLEKVIGW